MRLFVFSNTAHSSWLKASTSCKFLGCLVWTARLRSSQSSSMILRSRDWDGHSGTFTLFCCSQSQVDLAFDLDHYHVGISKHSPCAASRLSANFPLVCFNNKLHSSCHKYVAHTSPKHQRSTSMFYSRNGEPFITGLVDCSPNVTFMVVAKKLNFGLIINDYVPKVLRLVSVLFGTF